MEDIPIPKEKELIEIRKEPKVVRAVIGPFGGRPGQDDYKSKYVHIFYDSNCSKLCALRYRINFVVHLVAPWPLQNRRAQKTPSERRNPNGRSTKHFLLWIFSSVCCKSVKKDNYHHTQNFSTNLQIKSLCRVSLAVDETTSRGVD